MGRGNLGSPRCATRRRERCSFRRQGRWSGITGGDSSCQVQSLQILVALFLSRKQFLNPLQTFHRFVAHPVLHQDFRLQHQVLKRRSPQRRLLRIMRVVCRLGHTGKPRGNDFESIAVNFAVQHSQPLGVSGLVGVHFRGTVQTLGRLGKVSRTTVKIK